MWTLRIVRSVAKAACTGSDIIIIIIVLMLIIAVKWGLDAVRLGRQFIDHIIVIEIWQYVECLSERIMTRDMREILCKFFGEICNELAKFYCATYFDMVEIEILVLF